MLAAYEREIAQLKVAEKVLGSKKGQGDSPAVKQRLDMERDRESLQRFIARSSSE